MASFDELFDQFCVFGANYGILIFESSQTIKVFHIVDFVEVCDVSKIYRFYVALNLVSQFAPIKSFVELFQFASVGQLVQFPSVISGVHYLLRKFGSLMHQFFWNTSHIHACTSYSPFRFMQRLFNKIDHDYLQTMLIGLKSCG